MMRQFGLSVLLLAAAALTACSGGSAASKPSGSASAAAQSVTVKSNDTMRYDPATLTARANTPVNFTLDNGGSALVHDFVIDSPALKLEAQPHGRASGTATFPAGTYQYYCSQPGHKEAGMVGTLTAS